MMTPNMLEEETCCPRSSDSGECGGKVGSFGDGVHHDHHCVMTRGFQKSDDEVHADRVPGCRRHREGVQFSNWEVPLSLSVETGHR